MSSLCIAKSVVNPSTSFVWRRTSAPWRTSWKIGVVVAASSVTCVEGSIRRQSSCWSVTSAETAITLSAWDQTTPPSPPRKRKCGSVPSVFAARAVDPQLQAKGGTHSGLTISHCAMIVPNSLLKETSALSVISVTMMMTMRVR